MGIVIFGAMALYLLISIGVVVWAISFARKRGKSAKRWGFGAVLVMYLIPFWDWIPTVVSHKYYCATESGFWAYKTVDQWGAENPGVLETLRFNTNVVPVRQGNMRNYTDTYRVNDRISWTIKLDGPFFLHRWRHEQQLLDEKTGDVLARYIDFSTSQVQRQAGWTGWKFWLDDKHCTGGRHNKSLLRRLKDQLKGV